MQESDSLARKPRVNDSEKPSFSISGLQRMIADGAIGKSLGLKPEDLQAGLTVARNQLLRGAKTDALKTYITLVLCEPANCDFQLGLANCALQLNENDLALQAASAIIAIEPNNARAYYISGRACLALGHVAEAEEDLTNALNFGKEQKDSLIFSEAGLLLKRLVILKSA